MTKSLDIKNPDFAICEIATESGPSDTEMIRTIDHSPYRSFGDREFKRERMQCNKNLDFDHSDMQEHNEIAKAKAFHIKPWSQPLVTGREGVSPDKLHIGVSGIGFGSD
jgi:hypothetical protein